MKVVLASKCVVWTGTYGANWLLLKFYILVVCISRGAVMVFIRLWLAGYTIGSEAEIEEALIMCERFLIIIKTVCKMK